MATLDDLKDVFSSVNNSIVSLGSSLNIQMDTLNTNNADLLNEMKEQRKILTDILNLEKNRDKVKTDTTFAEENIATGDNGANVKSSARAYGEDLGAGLALIPSSLLAASAALALAFAGLRGWEVKIIDYVKGGIGNITESITKGLKSIKTSIFLSFGLDDAGKVLPNSALDDLLKTPIVKSITSGLSKLLTPIKMMGDFLGGLFSGSGGDATTGKAIKFLSEIGDNVGAFAKTVGKILKPIGFLFSAYDGVMAFMNTEGSLMDKFIAGIGGFLGDFVGAPLDLLKDIVSWGMSAFGFENVSKFLDDFSVETVINDMINGIWDMVKSAAEWVGLLFTDPVAALTEYWNSLYGDNGLIDMLFTPVSMAIDWIAKKFNWREEDAPTIDIHKTVSEFVSSLFVSIKEKLTSLSNMLSEGFSTVVDYLSGIPERVKSAAEGMVNDVALRLEKGFILFGDWIASIPARIKLLALSAINSALSGLPEWAQIVSAEDVAAAQTAVNQRSDSTKQKLEDLESRMYNSAEAATAESPIISGNADRIRMDRDRQNMVDFQKRFETLSKGDSRSNAPITAITGSGNTDARQTSTSISITNNQTQRNYSELNQAGRLGF